MKALGSFDELAPDLPRPAVLCTIVKVTGSCPQETGAKMWVTPGGFYGTLGGGRFELEVLNHARELLDAPQTAHLREYVLCKELGQCCGGRAQVFFEPAPRRKAIHLFGAGHVGRATAHVLAGTPLRLSIIDARPEWIAKEGLPPEARAVRAEPLEYCRSRAWSEDDAACIFTHSHDLDLLLVEFFLRQPVGFLGLIGSEHKAEVFKARLLNGLSSKDAETVETLWEEKVRCPVGIPLSSKNPKVIGVSIAAEVLQTWGLQRSVGAAERRKPVAP
ncbi:MAG: xanthine dehydrogenase accessory protein XdhC [Elusimicrobia bacterium]|nr:xanthine dehydrogenase accessory protein XdhC [Elusimicrobiota bacterium]